jgi:hypothetical protein
MTRPATVDPVPFLARQLADWLVLWTFHRRGVVAAVEAMNSAGGCGRGEDEVWRCWDTINAGRHKVSYREADRPTVVVGVRAVLDWAAARLDPADWARLDELVTARDAAVEQAHWDGELWRRQTYRPAELTDAERAVIAAGDRARYAAETAMRALVRSRLEATEPRAGDQLVLFPEAD